jgi:hypothetical protein
MNKFFEEYCKHLGEIKAQSMVGKIGSGDFAGFKDRREWIEEQLRSQTNDELGAAYFTIKVNEVTADMASDLRLSIGDPANPLEVPATPMECMAAAFLVDVIQIGDQIRAERERQREEDYRARIAELMQQNRDLQEEIDEYKGLNEKIFKGLEKLNASFTKLDGKCDELLKEIEGGKNG